MTAEPVQLDISVFKENLTADIARLRAVIRQAVQMIDAARDHESAELTADVRRVLRSADIALPVQPLDTHTPPTTTTNNRA